MPSFYFHRWFHQPRYAARRESHDGCAWKSLEWHPGGCPSVWYGAEYRSSAYRVGSGIWPTTSRRARTVTAERQKTRDIHCRYLLGHRFTTRVLGRHDVLAAYSLRTSALGDPLLHAPIRYFTSVVNSCHSIRDTLPSPNLLRRTVVQSYFVLSLVTPDVTPLVSPWLSGVGG